MKPQRVAVKHPEVDEILFCDLCVVKVPCPQCRVPKGWPCRGSRLYWIAHHGMRRGHRFTQGHHVARRALWNDLKRGRDYGRLAHAEERATTDTFIDRYGDPI
jgi:hypothetical protein